MTLALALLALATPQKPKALLVNGDFTNGLDGWKVQGKAKAEQGALVIEGVGAVRQRYEVPGLRIIYFGANLKSSNPKSDIRVQCFDAKGRLLLSQSAGADAKKPAGIYLKTHAFTSYVILCIEKTSAAGTLTADGLVFQDDDKNRVEHTPEVDLDAYMKPIWTGDTVLNESVLLLSEKGAEPAGKLLFKPSRIVTVRDTTLHKTYLEGKDFSVEGQTIIALKGSTIPTMSDAEIPKEQFPWADLAGRHVFVTYTHADKWSGPVPGYQGDSIPLTMQKLKGGKPLTVVAYGDSITLGINVSGYRNVPPYMPTWASLFTRQLGIRYRNDKVKLFNTGLGGMTTWWAVDNARDVVASLKPDLVLIAFGMNDFWSLTPAEFRKNIETTMATIRAKRPKVEFILIASMKFDPAYTNDPTYVGNLAGYATELRAMSGPGVAVFDMTALSDTLYQIKGQKGLATDPMHPDDFLARWYAQGLFALLDEPAGRR